MNKRQILKEYSYTLEMLRKQCCDAGMPEAEFKKMYFEALNEIQKENKTAAPRPDNYLLKFTFLSIVLAFSTIVVYNFNVILSNLQEYIYPGLHTLRRLAIPVISLFPSLTEWYYETCLLTNPFFTVVDMECWPCSSITSVQELQEPVTKHQDYRAPFIYKTDQEAVNWEILKNFYIRNKLIFDNESPNVVTADNYIVSASEMFSKNYYESGENPYIWKLNTMDTARLVRQLVSRPKVVPRFGQSTERFLIIDRSQRSKPFPLPDTECNYSFITALSGSRLLELRPAEECKHHCKSLQVELKESQLLWYNWWFYKPIIQPSNGNETLIAHIGSYC